MQSETSDVEVLTLETAAAQKLLHRTTNGLKPHLFLSVKFVFFLEVCCAVFDRVASSNHSQ